MADFKAAFLYGEARRPLYVELPAEDPCQLLVDTWENLYVPCMELETFL